MKRFAKLIALALAAMLVLSGCSMITVDKEMDDAEVVAEYSGGKITKGEAMAEYEATIAPVISQYNLTDEQTEQIKSNMLDNMVRERLIKAKAEELGLTNLSDEERAELLKQAEEQFEDMVEYYQMFFTTEGGDEAQARQDTLDYLASQSATLEAYQELTLENDWQNKLREEITKDVQVTDEQLEAAYQEAVASAEETYS